MLAANVLCLKKKKKRTYCLSNPPPSNWRDGCSAGTSKNDRSQGGRVTMMHITEDTPPDMLAGAMDLTVHLPAGRTVKMSVERSTPMMDLLVQITTTNQLQLSNHTLQALGMAPLSGHGDNVLPFKPNTPIGALDTQHIRVLPKGRTLPAPKYAAPGHQPFESTFRLKVHLPRNQLYVTRVSRNVFLEDIMKKVCEEKNLDPVKYEFKHPGNLDQALDPKLTLSDYQITEIFVVAKGAASRNQAFSAADIMTLRKEEERKQMHNKTGGGVFNLIFKRGKSSMGSGSVSSDNRSISPTHSDDSRSVTPPALQAPPAVPPPNKDPAPPDGGGGGAGRPKPPQRKRRPAPKPPQPRRDAAGAAENGVATTTTTTTICHSRNSSDSSGYHEASVLSDHHATLPRGRPKSAAAGPPLAASSLGRMGARSRSTTSLIAGRKKKAAPPPPLAASTPLVASSRSNIAVDAPSEEPTSSTSISTPAPDRTPPAPSTVRGRDGKSPERTADRGIAQEEVQSDRERHPQGPFSLRAPPLDPADSEDRLEASVASGIDLDTHADEILGEIVPPPPPLVEEPYGSGLELQVNRRTGSPTVQEVIGDDESDRPQVAADLVDIDWQYELPSPPKAFRDDSSSPAEERETDYKDSVVTCPELFEKLRDLEDAPKSEEASSAVGEEPLNTLSLEHLEKRRSLVYNRELATSFKVTGDDGLVETGATETFSSCRSPAATCEEDDSRERKRASKPAPPPPTTTTTTGTSALPNFKITTYDVPQRQKVTVFEDDAVSSGANSARTTDNVPSSLFGRGAATTTEDEREYGFHRATGTGFGPLLSRSGSFSVDGRSPPPSKPVSRSRSQLALNGRAGRTDGEEGALRSDSSRLFDVSGLHSLGVIRLIQNKLNTPTGSMENLSFKGKPLNAAPVARRHRDKPPAEIRESEPPHAAGPELAEEGRSRQYYYRGPPAVNMTTWSERPKVPVAVKEDADYKSGSARKDPDAAGQISHTSGNVVIRIGGCARNKETQQRFVGPTAYRKPFADVNRNPGGGTTITTTNPRPHSVAFGADFDMSRVPVVRAVEFKKPRASANNNNNTSVTRICQGDDDDAGVVRSAVFRVRSFKPADGVAAAAPPPQPVVRGFKTSSAAADVVGHRVSWNHPLRHAGGYGTLPAKNKTETWHVANQRVVPFSRSTLRRAESIKIDDDRCVAERMNAYSSLPPTVADRKLGIRPEGGKNETVVPPDTRNMLLESIRNFGGKKGLKAVNA